MGLLRKRSSSSSAQNWKKLRKTKHLFAYLIVIDFESTCWQDSKQQAQEIIEFPAVLLNTETGNIVAEFHHYVQPQEHPTLSSFCKELTGITQDQVDQGIPLSFCLRRFTNWLRHQAQERSLVYNTMAEGHNACTFVTWSDWDLGVCLQYECRRKQIRKPPELTSWIDLRATYRKFYERRPKGLNGALQDLGIPFQGREHSGLCDARNTAHLAWRMMCDGCIMNITKTMAPTSAVVAPVSTARSMPPGMPQPSAGTSNQPHDKGLVSGGPVSVKPSITRQAPISNQPELGCKGKELHTSPGGDAATGVVIDKSASNMGSWVFKTPNNLTCKTDTPALGLYSGLERHAIKTGCHSVQFPGTTGKENLRTPSTTCSVTNSKDSLAFKTPSILTNRKNSLTVPSLRTPSPYLNSNIPSAGTNRQPLHIVNGQTRYQTPNMSTMTLIGSNMKRTPPMCECGRRSQRKFVQTPGPNTGRAFYCCPLGRKLGDKARCKKQGCGYFKWESSCSMSPGSALPGRGQKIFSLGCGRVNSLQSCVTGPIPQPDFSTPQSNVRHLSGMTRGCRM